MMLVSLLLSIIVITSGEQPPNILFILVDDLGWGNIGFNSPQNTEIVTPNIDRLATQEGLILNRHYVHYCCSPTRTSFQSGRLPVHVNLGNSDAAENQFSGVPINMTVIAEKLNLANYSSHIIGKWDAGSATYNQIPISRGYNSSYGYLSHANTYFNNYEWAHPCTKYPSVGQIYDLWSNDKPAYNDVDTGEFIEFKFASKVYDLLDAAKDSNHPFFIMYASHLSHDPLQMAQNYFSIWDNDESNCSQHDPFIYPGFNGTFQCRSVVQSMINLLDIIVGNITTKLKQNGQWNNTLIVFTGDNGGCQWLRVCAGNSHPLRGGKGYPFEGGIRTVTFVSGGYLPSHRYGKVENGMVHISDWYKTFLSMNNIDATDERAKRAGLPPVDGLDIWDLIIGRNSTSPRIELPIDANTLIQNQYKFITNTTVAMASWTGEIFPNASSEEHSVENTKLNCLNGCLFDIVNDMTEHNNIINSNKNIANAMYNRLKQLKKGYYTNNEKGVNVCPKGINISCACWAAKNKYKGFYGPYQTVSK